MVVNYQVV